MKYFVIMYNGRFYTTKAPSWGIQTTPRISEANEYATREQAQAVADRIETAQVVEIVKRF